MTLEEAIKTAIGYEKKVHGTYVEACEKASDAVGQRVFRVLAEEERGHIEYLESRLSEWRKTGHLTVGGLETAVPPRERIEAGVSRLQARMTEGKASKQELELLRRALQVEQETSAFYKQMVSELSDVGRRLFERFVEIEEGHLAIVQAEMDALRGHGFWFDMKEFQLELG
jgi:rubrerythrin